MTKLYNVRSRLQEIEARERRRDADDAEGVAPRALSESERAIHDAGCVGVIHELHKEIDAAVADAYGWAADLSDEEILARLVALNRERAAEERRGLVRWLRPDYQIPRAKGRAVKEEQIEAPLDAAEAQRPTLPKDDAALVAALRRALRGFGRPAAPKALALHFREGAKGARRVERGLRLLAAAGVVRRAPSGGWFLPGERIG